MIEQYYHTILNYDIDGDGLLDVVASLTYADLPYGAGGPRTATVVAVRQDDSLVLHFSTQGQVKEIIDTLIPGSVILWDEWHYSHGFSHDVTTFYQIWPKKDTLLETYTFTYDCSEQEEFRFVEIKKSEPRLIARFFERSCDPRFEHKNEKPEKKLQVFRFDKKLNRYQEWRPKDEKIWKKIKNAFSSILEAEDFEKLKNQQNEKNVDSVKKN